MLQEMALLYHSFTIESSRVQPVICMSNKHDIWSTDDKEIFVLLRTELVPAKISQFEERKNGNSVYTDTGIVPRVSGAQLVTPTRTPCAYGLFGCHGHGKPLNQNPSVID